jgi:hypothetical protein
VPGLQAGVDPKHSVLLVAEHWPHAPLDSHAGVAPLQSVSAPHFVHCPVTALQTGVVPKQSEARQARHLWVPVLQNGFPPEQSASTMQSVGPMHLPVLEQAPSRQIVAPLPLVHGPSPHARPHLPSAASQTCDRQSVPWLPVVQGPSPLAYPHSLSPTSHTPLVHTSAPIIALQMPSRMGEWLAMVGMGVPFASLAVQAFVWVLQNCADPQSESFVQPPTQTLPVHVPERHWAVAVQAEPVRRPHMLSEVSQIPLAQTAVPTAVAGTTPSGLHSPSSTGVWPLILGTATPLAIFDTQLLVSVSQNWVARQFASVVQPAHVPAVQTLLRHWALPPGHASPDRRPQRLSLVEQTPLTHTTVPTAAEQTPVSGGVCPTTEGTSPPLATLLAQTVFPVSQNCVDGQSESCTQPAQVPLEQSALRHCPLVPQAVPGL